MRELVDRKQLEDNFNLVNYLFPRNPKIKNAFLAVYYCLDKNVFLYVINDMAPIGGLIGIPESYTDRCLSFIKIWRMHAVFDDAFAFMKSIFDVGPVYVYTITEKPIFVDNMVLCDIWCPILALSEIVPWNTLRTGCILIVTKIGELVVSFTGVACEYHVITHFRESVSIEQNTKGKQSNIRLTLTELVRLNQTIQIISSLYAFRNHLSQ